MKANTVIVSSYDTYSTGYQNISIKAYSHTAFSLLPLALMFESLFEGKMAQDFRE